MMQKVIGIDVGGTNLRGALVDANGQMGTLFKEEFGPARDMDSTIKRLERFISFILKKSGNPSVHSVGLGIPGIVSFKEGVVYASPHYPQWKNFNLLVELSKTIHRPVVMDNDANLIAYGEQWKGNAKDWNIFLTITLGTGIGGGIITESGIFRGNSGFAGEIGHMVIEVNGPPCACGSQGCFELFASASALKQSAHSLALQARAGDVTAKAIYQQLGYYLGIGIASLVNVTGIQNILLGGGLMGAKDLFLAHAIEEMKKRTYAQTAKGIQIRKTGLGDHAGILGAARLALESIH